MAASLWKQVFPFFYLLLCLAGPSLAKDGGRIEVLSSQSVDFGKYPAWEEKIARYEIRNSGQNDLKIIKVRKTCGCASAKCDKETLKPGQTGLVEVVILPNSIFGLYKKNTYVESSDEASRFTVLTVSGNAIPLVEVSPKPSVYAGRIKNNTGWAKVFTLKSEKEGLELGEPRVHSDYAIDVRVKKKNESQYELRAGLKPSSESGDLKCKIVIPIEQPLLRIGDTTTNHAPVNLSIRGKVGYELSAVPGIARIPVLESGPITRHFRFHVLGQRSRQLLPAELELPERKDVEFNVKQGQNSRYLEVKAIFTPEFSKALFTAGTIPLEFSVPEAASATIICQHKE